MNLENGLIQRVVKLDPPEGGMPEGCVVTQKYDVYSWVFMTVMSGVTGARYDDRVDLLQLDSRRDWFKVYSLENDQVQKISGVLPAGQSEELRLKVNSAELPPVEFNGIVEIIHNAASVRDTLQVRLNVVADTKPSPFSLMQPPDSSICDLNDSSSVTFSWTTSLPNEWKPKVNYSFWMKSGQAVAKIGEAKDTFITVDFAALDYEKLNFALPDSFGSTEWWVLAVSGVDTTICISPFTLFFKGSQTGPGKEWGEGSVPVSFGIASVYPSPFNAVTTIRYGADKPERMRIVAYSIDGRLAAVISDRREEAGWHRTEWNASALASGVYILRLEAASRAQTTKVVLVK